MRRTLYSRKGRILRLYRILLLWRAKTFVGGATTQGMRRRMRYSEYRGALHCRLPALFLQEPANSLWF